ncbi:hypothetical protein BDQ17DRAFT_1349935 [Cyathus striatus]|nr:hypothetical protein BDQ17DRAFT_1349935 [Cyathus striatus]
MAERNRILFTWVDIVGLVLTVGYGIITFRLSLRGQTTASHILNFFGVLIVIVVYWLRRYQKFLERSSGRQRTNLQEGAGNSPIHNPDSAIESRGRRTEITDNVSVYQQNQENTGGARDSLTQSSDAPESSSSMETTDTNKVLDKEELEDDKPGEGDGAGAKSATPPEPQSCLGLQYRMFLIILELYNC